MKGDNYIKRPTQHHLEGDTVHAELVLLSSPSWLLFSWEVVGASSRKLTRVLCVTFDTAGGGRDRDSLCGECSNIT